MGVELQLHSILQNSQVMSKLKKGSKKLEIESIPLELISEITDIYKINNEYRQMFCFAISLSNQKIVNVSRTFNAGNSKEKNAEIRALHAVIRNKFDQYINQEIKKEL